MSENSYRELLLGCGHSRIKKYQAQPKHPRGWQGALGVPVTLDVSLKVNPDIWCDLNAVPPWVGYPALDPDLGAEAPAYSRAFTLEENYWDEIHAYQVLEHLGQQGDANSFFKQFAELWRILKPDGYLVASVPSRFSGWLWGDPSHRRAILPESLVFLDQSEYIKQIDERGVGMSDFRDLYRADFRCTQQADNREDFVFVLQAIKPSRWKMVEARQ